MAANLYRGDTSMRDYTPAAAVDSGDVIAIGDLQYIAHLDIAADELGALACPTGSAAYKVDVEGALTLADGAAVNYDTTTGQILNANTGVFLGYAEGAVASGDTYAIVRHQGKVGAEA